MSSINSLSGSAALPIAGVHGHGHRKGGAVLASASTDAMTSTDGSSDASSPATSQGIFSSLLQTAEQIAGVQLTAPKSSAATPTVAQNSVGGRINVTA